MDQETWRNASNGRVGINKLDRHGELDQRLISGGVTILLTPQERAINQDMAANEELDVFSNGTMVPVRLIDAAEDTDSIKSNPNLKSEEDLKGLFKLQWKNFEKELSQIKSSVVLQRIREIAESQDATVRQMTVIDNRIKEVDPGLVVLETNVQSYSSEPTRTK